MATGKFHMLVLLEFELKKEAAKFWIFPNKRLKMGKRHWSIFLIAFSALLVHQNKVHEPMTTIWLRGEICFVWLKFGSNNLSLKPSTILSSSMLSLIFCSARSNDWFGRTNPTFWNKNTFVYFLHTHCQMLNFVKCSMICTDGKHNLSPTKSKFWKIKPWWLCACFVEKGRVLSCVTIPVGQRTSPG